MIRKQKNYKTQVALAACILNKQYVMTQNDNEVAWVG